MKASEAIKTMLEESGLTGTEVSRRLGKSRKYMSTILTTNRIPQLDTLAKMADSMGYQVIIRGHGAEYVIEADSESSREEQG